MAQKLLESKFNSFKYDTCESILLTKVCKQVRYPKAFEGLVTYFTRFSGIGRKTAERFVFDILNRWDKQAIDGFSKALQDLSRGVVLCAKCKTHIESLPCPLCAEQRVSEGLLCVVASSKDVYSLEETNLFHGTYFVVGSLISPLDNRGIQDVLIDDLKSRIVEEKIREVVLAFDSSVEGDATASFLKDQLSSMPVMVSRLASGVPVGAPLEFVDRGTLGRALQGRQKML
jgi:recombination protein RecR